MTAEVLLSTHGLSRRFGGLTAVDGVSIECRSGQVHAVIGPNGAGKSTLINLLSGDLKPSAGTVRLRGTDVTGLPPHRISQLGVGRSYQKTNVFLPFSAFENCRLAAQSRMGSSMRFLRPALRCRQAREAAERALSLVGLDQRAHVPVAELSHGEQREVEIAMTLATDPDVLLLDEPLAGIGAGESARIVDLLGKLAPDHAILLVEHDMDAVFALAHTLTVMVNGAVLESGPPQEVRASRAVQEAYLGELSH
ncbi:MAG TPA: ABC transporter ATP-binding protein [Burkholderiales bacterium]|jgi:branched-chain amino acid transport system ATP-binding protein|nr:ABC transporter ATP-binding protein [Burkholderiales bacterium]